MSAVIQSGLSLLDSAIARIEEHPEDWNQGEWRCGTGQCLGGHIAEIAGGRWADSPVGPYASYMLAESGDDPSDLETHSEIGRLIHVGTRARRLLGFSPYMDEALGCEWDRRSLFTADNSLDDIKRMRDHLYAHLLGEVR